MNYPNGDKKIRMLDLDCEPTLTNASGEQTLALSLSHSPRVYMDGF